MNLYLMRIARFDRDQGNKSSRAQSGCGSPDKFLSGITIYSSTGWLVIGVASYLRIHTTLKGTRSTASWKIRSTVKGYAERPT